MSTVFRNKDKLFRLEENEFCTVPVELELPESSPMIRWKKNKIPYDLWGSIVRFMLDSYKHLDAEAMITLFYNPESGEWAAHAFPQTTFGMSVETDQSTKEYKEQRSLFPSPFIELGSVHHHCKVSAFASGTDKEDEIDRDGLHITLGHMDQRELDIHARATIQGRTQMADLVSWIDVPEWVRNIPENMEELREQAVECVLLDSDLFKEFEYPKIWRKNLKKKTHFHPLERNTVLGKKKRTEHPSQLALLR